MSCLFSDADITLASANFAPGQAVSLLYSAHFCGG
jgi:hypothetical protein